MRVRAAVTGKNGLDTFFDDHLGCRDAGTAGSRGAGVINGFESIRFCVSDDKMLASPESGSTAASSVGPIAEIAIFIIPPYSFSTESFPISVSSSFSSSLNASAWSFKNSSSCSRLTCGMNGLKPRTSQGLLAQRGIF